VKKVVVAMLVAKIMCILVASFYISDIKSMFKPFYSVVAIGVFKSLIEENQLQGD